MRPDYGDYNQHNDESGSDDDIPRGYDDGSTISDKGKKYNKHGGAEAAMIAEGDREPAYACMSNPYLIDCTTLPGKPVAALTARATALVA